MDKGKIKNEKSLYAQYVLEREGFETVEDRDGFVTYRINGDECYIRDIYITPINRRLNMASGMADRVAEIAKANGCKYLSGSVHLGANAATASLKTLLGYGFKLHSVKGDMIWFTKELK